MKEIFHALGTLSALALFASLVALSSFAGAQDAPVCDPDLFITKKVECYLNAAESRGDPAVCLEVEDPVRFQCISLYAERNGKPDACGLLEGEGADAVILRNSCIAGVAVANVDPPLCEAVEVANLRDVCYLKLVVERGVDASFCAEIANPALKDACLGN